MNESIYKCDDWSYLVKNHPDLFKKDIDKWSINWIELTEEKGYTQVNRYGIRIRYCPMCGKKITGA